MNFIPGDPQADARPGVPFAVRTTHGTVECTLAGDTAFNGVVKGGGTRPTDPANVHHPVPTRCDGFITKLAKRAKLTKKVCFFVSFARFASFVIKSDRAGCGTVPYRRVAGRRGSALVAHTAYGPGTCTQTTIMP